MEREIIYQSPESKITVVVPESLAIEAINFYLRQLGKGGASLTVIKKGEA